MANPKLSAAHRFQPCAPSSHASNEYSRPVTLWNMSPSRKSPW